MTYELIREILGNKVYKDTETGKEYLMDFVNNELIELKGGTKKWNLIKKLF